MSNTANWSYTNSATVKPFLSLDMMTGVKVYGEPYEIACTWVAKSAQTRDNDGQEFVSRFEVYTEDDRPQYLDLILLSGDDEWQEVRARTHWDMSFFGEKPDYLLVT